MCERWIVSLVIPSKCKPGCQSYQNCCSGMGQINDWIQPTVTVDGLELQDSYCCCLWLGLAVRSLPLTKLWLIESGLSLPYAFRYKKPGFLPWTPLPPPMRRTTFHVRWHRMLKSVMLIQGGRERPSPKVRAFCNRGWPDRGKFCGSIACQYSTGLCSYSQKNRRTRDVQIETTMHYRNF